MPHTLPAIIAHIRTANRPQSHGAILLREIERLQREIATLRADGAPTPEQSCQETRHA